MFTLRKGLGAALALVAPKSDPRQVLRGANVKRDDDDPNVVKLQATDGKMGIQVRIAGEIESEGIIGRDALSAIDRAIPNKRDAKARIDVNGAVDAKVGEEEMSFARVDGTFPNFDMVIPNTSKEEPLFWVNPTRLRQIAEALEKAARGAEIEHVAVYHPRASYLPKGKPNFGPLVFKGDFGQDLEESIDVVALLMPVKPPALWKGGAK